MALGYVFGTLYRPEFGAARRKKWLLWTGTAAILLFLVLRGLNLYGDPNPWSRQPTLVYSILSFLNTTKYPTSLHFLLMTIGPATVFLALTEGVKSRIAGVVLMFGRVSLFFYLVHIHANGTAPTRRAIPSRGYWHTFNRCIIVDLGGAFAM